MGRPKNKQKPARKRLAPLIEDPGPADALRYVTDSLHAVRHALEDFNAAPTPERKLTAFSNFLENNRQVTWKIHKLKSRLTDDEWSKWWAAVAAEISADPAAQFIYDLRNFYAKQGGGLDLSVSAEFKNLSTKDLPPGIASVAVTGDLRRVWIKDDGSQVPAEVPLGQDAKWETVRGMPTELASVPLPLLLQRHLEMLERLVIATILKFGGE